MEYSHMHGAFLIMSLWNITRLCIVIIGLLGTSACASITAGTTQAVAVNTAPKDGAECKLANEKGTWSVPKTPGSATVTKAYGDLTIACEHPDGSKGAGTLSSTTAGAAFGNIIAGGIIGAAVDMGSGAAYTYPSTIAVALASPVGAPAAPVVPVAGTSPVQIGRDEAERRLRSLADLKNKKLITEAEYRQKSKEILGQM